MRRTWTTCFVASCLLAAMAGVASADYRHGGPTGHGWTAFGPNHANGQRWITHLTQLPSGPSFGQSGHSQTGIFELGDCASPAGNGLGLNFLRQHNGPKTSNRPHVPPAPPTINNTYPPRTTAVPTPDSTTLAALGVGVAGLLARRRLG